jgi:hypothetical protein
MRLEGSKLGPVTRLTELHLPKGSDFQRALLFPHLELPSSTTAATDPD